MALMSLSAACELTYNAMDQVRTLRFAFDANSVRPSPPIGKVTSDNSGSLERESETASEGDHE